MTNITLSDGIETISNSMFRDCTNLTNISLPENVRCIELNAFFNTGYYNDNNNWENDILYLDNHLIEARKTISGEYQVKPGTITIAAFSFYLNKDSIMVYGWTIKRSGDGQDKKS